MPSTGHTLVLLIAAAAAAPAAFGQTATSYSLRTLAGGDFVGDGGPASSALLTQLEGIAVDLKGAVYISDAGGHRVRKIAPDGIVSTVAGNGHPGFSGDGGPAAAAQLRTPYGITVDLAGNLYIADLGNARIRLVRPDGVISTFAGGGNTPAVQGSAIPAKDIALVSPRNVVADRAGSLYFSDFGGHRVYQVSAQGYLTVLAGTGQYGFSGDGGPAISARISAPAGMAVGGSGAVYFADTGNGRIRKVDHGVITTLGDGGNPGSARSLVPVTLPIGLALDSDGTLYIADGGGNQVLRLTPNLESSPLAQPARDIAIDLQGNLYACTGGLLYRRPRTGGSALIAGGTIDPPLGDGGPLLQARLNRPGGIARDAAGNVYVADTWNHRVRQITPGGSINTVAGNGVRGYSGDGGSAMAAQLDTPIGLAVDRSGNLYIADSGNQRIRKVDPAGFISTAVGTGVRSHSPDGTLATYAQLDTPAWLALDKDGTLYFSEIGGNAVRKVTATGQVQTVAGVGQRGYDGDGGPALQARLDSPQGIAIDASGNLYIADAGNRRIRRVAPSGPAGSPTITTFPGANASAWGGLRGLAVDAPGSLYVTDADQGRVFRIDLPDQMFAIAGLAFPSFTGESGAALQQGLDTPAGVAVDDLGNVYLADSGNGRIRVLTPIADSKAAPLSLAIVNSASLSAGPIAPGELVSIFGAGLGPEKGVSAPMSAVELGGTQVVFNGRLAPLSYASQGQINLQAPYSFGDARPCEVRVLVGGIVKARASVTIADAAPAVFTAAGGSGQAAALNEDGSFNSSDNPADRGSVIVLFATGGGQTSPAGIEGRPAGWPAPVPLLPISVRIGDYPAQVLYAAEAPGFSGLLQVNARIPGGFAPPGILAVTLQAGSVVSQPGVTVAVR